MHWRSAPPGRAGDRRRHLGERRGDIRGFSGDRGDVGRRPNAPDRPGDSHAAVTPHRWWTFAWYANVFPGWLGHLRRPRTGRPVWRSRSAEAQSVDQGFADRLALWYLADLDDLNAALAELGEAGCVGFVGAGVEEERQFVSAVAQLADRFGDLLDAAGDGVTVPPTCPSNQATGSSPSTCNPSRLGNPPPGSRIRRTETFSVDQAGSPPAGPPSQQPAVTPPRPRPAASCRSRRTVRDGGPELLTHLLQ